MFEKSGTPFFSPQNGYLLRQKALSNVGLTAFFLEPNHFGTKIPHSLYFQTSPNPYRRKENVMKYCKNCGSENNDDNQFCFNCRCESFTDQKPQSESKAGPFPSPAGPVPNGNAVPPVPGNAPPVNPNMPAGQFPQVRPYPMTQPIYQRPQKKPLTIADLLAILGFVAALVGMFSASVILHPLAAISALIGLSLIHI